MQGLILTIADWLHRDASDLLAEVQRRFPEGQTAQIRSWQALIHEIKSADALASLPETCVLALEYALPTDGMAIDILAAGLGPDGRKTACIVEAKQWSDDFIEKSRFSAYREPETELHPQVQVSRHCLSFSRYLDIGPAFAVHPFVYAPNASPAADRILTAANPRAACAKIPILHGMDALLREIGRLIHAGDPAIIRELQDAQFSPSRGVIDAMEAVVTKNETFLLTPEQQSAADQVWASFAAGKKVIRITGAAGAGKTGILLNLYVQALNEAPRTGLRPIFVTGAQNTAYYRSAYPQAENSFTYSFSLNKMLTRDNASQYIIFMDEAQHNQPGIVTRIADLGARLVLCYDVTQVINPENAAAELRRLEQRPDFLAIALHNRIRFSGSQSAEENIRTFLRGGTDFQADPLFDFQVFRDFGAFQERILDTIRRHPDDTMAVMGLLSADAKSFTREQNPSSRLFTNWQSKTECQWIPYVRGRHYLEQFNGGLWVGTWWMPGLDVDYVAVIVGGDAALTSQGVVANPAMVKHYRMIVALAQKQGLPENLIAWKYNYGEGRVDYYKSVQNILAYLEKTENAAAQAKLVHSLSQYLRNNYYIMLTRGRKGCFVYLANDQRPL